MTARDPVCGAEVDTLRARAVAIVDATTFYFCSAAHKEQFLRDRSSAPAPAPPTAFEPPAHPERRPEGPESKGPVPVPVPAPDTLPEAVADEPAEIATAPKRAGGALRYVVVVLILFAGAVAIAIFSRR